MSAKKPSSSRNKFVVVSSAMAVGVALYFGWQWAGQDASLPVAEKQVAKSTVTSPVKSAETAPVDTPKSASMPAGGDRLYTVEEGDLMIDEILRSTKEIPEMARELHELVKS